MNSNRDDMENSGGFIKEFLDRECEADAALSARLEALLAAHDQPNELLSKPIFGEIKPWPKLASVPSTEVVNLVPTISFGPPDRRSFQLRSSQTDARKSPSE
jgi:hypothetical protein